MKYIICFLFCLCSISIQAQKHSFSIHDGDFYYDGKPVEIHAGEMHYERIPKEYWRHRLQMIKALGLNTVSTYVFWNYHNPAPGVWDFKSGNKDISAFIKMAQEEGLWVIIRPGPYACAEWEFGGYPWFLQNNEELTIRTNNPAFLRACEDYLGHLYAEIQDLFVSKGGPIIMVQAENEFGSYVSQTPEIKKEDHEAYKNKIHQMLKKTGFEEPFFTSDGTWLFEGGHVEGALPTANGEGNITNLKKAVNSYHNGEGPYMVAEFYPGWLDHWAEPFVTIPAADIAKQTKVFLDNKVSFNLYMVHGGTNFGFTAGANYNDEHDIQPDITSYDYDAPISEAGWATEKYKAIREVMANHKGLDKLPAIPEAKPIITIPSIALTDTYSVLDYLRKEKASSSDTPLTFEDLEQGYGYVLYSKRFTQPIAGTLQLDGLRDFATIYVNGKYVGTLNRYNKEYSLPIQIPFNGKLEILVENMGRINYGAEIVHNRKGIISPVLIEDYEITGGWEHRKMPLEEIPSHIKPTKVALNAPVFYKGSFSLETVGDTFLDMSQWGKGVVFVNGHNLGRFWKVGPQQTLYVPGVWLKKGENSIFVLEQLHEKEQQHIEAIATPILDQLAP